MNAIQLEFKIKDESDVEIKINYMQKELDDMKKSCDKVRKNYFHR
jgi:hypothetical protein